MLLNISERTTIERRFFFTSARRTVNMWLQVAVSDGLTVRPSSAAHKSVRGSEGPVVEH